MGEMDANLDIAKKIGFALLLSVAGSIIASKINTAFNADVRTSLALNRIAAALERAHPEHKPLPRPSLLNEDPIKSDINLISRPGFVPCGDDAITDSLGQHYRLHPGSKYPEACGGTETFNWMEKLSPVNSVR